MFGAGTLTRILSLALAILIAIPLQMFGQLPLALAQEASGNGDLSSTAQTEAASQHGDFGSANITVGANSITVTSESMLTPAELAALTQVLTAGTQTLQLNDLGAAIGGQLNLHSDIAGTLSNLVIPTGVSVLHDAALMQSINISQNVNNFGSLYAYSSNAAITSLTLNATNIYNNVGALITSVLPATGNLIIASSVGNLDISLNAINCLVNAGTISSSGNLSVTAQSITNTGVMQSMINMTMTAAAIQNMTNATMVAQQSMNLNTASLVNSGLMSALQGTLAVNNVSPTSLSILNSAGIMEALNGILSVTSSSGMNLTGGRFYGSSIDLNSSAGHVKADVDALTGPVSVKATDVALSTASDLNLVSLDASGDPFFSCNGCALSLAGGGVAGQPFTALAGTTISLTGNIVGSEIYLISGATFTQNPCSGCATPTTTVNSQSGTNAGIDLGAFSVTGTNINLLSAGNITSSTGSSINASGTLTMQATGDIQLPNTSAQATTIRTSSTTFTSLTFADSRCVTCVAGTRTTGSFGAGATLANTVTNSGTLTSAALTVNTGTLNVDTGTSMTASGNIILNLSNVNNSGTIRTTATNGSITVTSTGALNLGGSGGLYNTTTGNGTITFQTTGASALNVDASAVYNTNGTGSARFLSQASGASINIGNGVLVDADGSLVTLSSPNLSFGNNAAVTTTRTSGNAITINTGAAVAPLSITLADNALATLDTGGGVIVISAPSGQNLNISKAAGSGNATLVLSDGTVTFTTTNANTNVGAGLSVTSNRALTFNVQNGGFTNDGSISTTGSGTNLLIQSTVSSGNFTFGNFGTIAATGTLTVQTNPALGVGGSFTFNNSGSMSGGTSVTLQNVGSVSGGVFAFINDGTIVSGTSMLVSNSAVGGSLNFTNNNLLQATTTFTIQNAGANGQALVQNNGSLLAGLGTSLIRNSGTAGSLTFNQFGTVTTTGSTANLTIEQTGNASTGGGNLSVNNSGSMTIGGNLVVQTNPSGGAGGTGTLLFNNASTGSVSTAGSALFQNLGSTSGSTFTFTNDGLVNAGTTMTITSNAVGGGLNFTNNDTMTANTAIVIQTLTSGNLSFTNNDSLSSTTSAITVQNTAAGGTLNAINDGSITSQTTMTIRTSGSNGQLNLMQNSSLSAGSSITIEQTGANGTASVTNNGTIVSTGTSGDDVLIQNTQGSLTYAGTGSISVSGGSSATITLTASATVASDLDIDGSHTFSTNATNGTVTFNSKAGAVNFASGVTENIVGALTISTPNLTFGADVDINVNKSTGNAVTINSGNNGNSLLITLPDSSAVTMQTTGGAYNIFTLVPTTGSSATITKSAGSGSSTLNALGGTFNLSSGSLTDIDYGVTIASDSNMNFTQTVSGGVIVINGTITSSQAGNWSYSASAFNGSTGSILFAPGDAIVGTIRGTGQVLQTGGGTPTIRIAMACCGFTVDDLTIDGQLTFNAGPQGNVDIRAFAATGLLGNITLTDNSVLNVKGGSTLNIPTPMLTLGANSLINIEKSTGTALSFTGNWVATTGNFIRGPEGSSATIQSTGGLLLFNECCSTPWTFETSTGTGTTTFNLLGGNVQIGNLNGITIAEGVTLAANRNITINTHLYPQYSNPGTLTNNGLVTTSAVNGVITLNFSNTFTTDSNILNGSGAFTVTGGGASQIIVSQNSPRNLTFAGNLTFDAGSGGSVTFQTTQAGAGLIFAANTTQSIVSGAPLVISTPNLTLNSGAVVQGSASISIWTTVLSNSGTIVTTSAASNPWGHNILVADQNSLGVTLTGNGNGVFQSAGGLINIQSGNVAGVRVSASQEFVINGPSGMVNFMTYGSSAAGVTVDDGVTVKQSGNGAIGLAFNTPNVSIGTGAHINAAGVLTIATNNLTVYGTLSTTTSTLNTWGQSLVIAAYAGGVLNLNGTPAAITATNGYIDIYQGGANAINVNGSYTFSVGAGNKFIAVDATAAGASINVAAGALLSTAAGTGMQLASATINVADGATVHSGQNTNIYVTNLSMGNNALVIVSGPGDLNFYSLYSNPGDITVTLSAGAQATMSTNGGTVNFLPVAGQSLSFSNQSATGPLSILRVEGGDATMTTTGAGITTINPYVCVACEGNLTISGAFVNNGGCLDGDSNITFTNVSTLSNNGNIAADGSIQLTTLGDLVLTGSGSLQSPNISLVSTGGVLSVTQGSISGALNGSAATYANIYTTTGGLDVGNVSAPQMIVLYSAGVLNISGNVESPTSSWPNSIVELYASDINIAGSVSADHIYMNPYSLSAQIGIGDTHASNGPQFYLSEADLNNITATGRGLHIGLGGYAQYGQTATGGVLVTGDIDLTGTTITNLTIANTGAYSATGSNITFDPYTYGFNVSGSTINTGSASGTGAFTFYSSGQLTVDGNLALAPSAWPYSIMELYGTDIDIPGTVSADNIYMNTSNLSAQIGIGDTHASNGPQFYLSEADLNNITATGRGLHIGLGGYAQFGQTATGGVLVTGDIDLTGTTITNLTIANGGSYNATGSNITFDPYTYGFNVSGSTINTGSASGTGAFTFYSSGQLTVDGNLALAPSAWPYSIMELYGTDIDIPGSISADNIYMNTSNLSAQIGIGDTHASNGPQFYLSEADLNNITATGRGLHIGLGGYAQFGQTATGGVLVTGDIDLAGTTITNLTIANGGSYNATGSNITFDPFTYGFNVSGSTINTGSASGTGAFTFYSNGQLTVDGNLALAPSTWPYSIMELYGTDIDIPGTISADNIYVAPNTQSAAIGLGDTNVSNGPQFYLSETELNNITATGRGLHIGQAGYYLAWTVSSGGVLVTGDIDLTNSGVNSLTIANNSNYVATGSTLRMDCDQNLSITAHDLNTGNIVAHNPQLNASGALTTDGFLLDACALCGVANLDLTNSYNVNQIVGLQTLGYLGGTLQTSGGVAIGGDIILTPCGGSCDLSAVNVPADVLITFQGFSDTQVNVNLTSSSTSPTFYLAGTMNFEGSDGRIVVSSYTGDPAIQIASTGVLSADGSLTMYVYGDVSVDGAINTQDSLTLNLTALNQTLAVGGALNAANDLAVVFSGGGDKVLSLGANGSLNANDILVQWNTVNGGNFTMNSAGGSLNATESINYDFCCYYQPVATNLNFNGTASFNVTADTGTISVGSWCCSYASMNLNGNYDFNALGANSSINLFLGDQVNLNSQNTYTVGDNGTIFVGSYYTDMHVNAAQTFNTGTNSTVTLSGGSYGGVYDGGLYVDVSNNYNFDDGSKVTFRGGGAVEFGAGTTQSVGGDIEVILFGGTTNGYSQKDLVFGTGAALSADNILVQWSSQGAGNFTMNADGANLTAGESINFDFCCYYQPTGTAMNFEGSANLTVTGNNGLIQVGSWCCTTASMNFNGNYNLNASGDNSDINIFLGDVVNFAGANTFTVGNNGNITAGSYYSTTNVNTHQVFNTGTNSQVTLQAGQTMNLNASTEFNTGAGSNIDITTGCANGVINVAANTTSNGAHSLAFATDTLNLNSGAQVLADGNITLAQHTLVDNGATVTSTGDGTILLIQNCCTADLVLAGSGGNYSALGNGSTIALSAQANLTSTSAYTFSANGGTTFTAGGNTDVSGQTVVGKASFVSGGNTTASLAGPLNLYAANVNGLLDVSSSSALEVSGTVSAGTISLESCPSVTVNATASISSTGNTVITTGLLANNGAISTSGSYTSVTCQDCGSGLTVIGNGSFSANGVGSTVNLTNNSGDQLTLKGSFSFASAAGTYWNSSVNGSAVELGADTTQNVSGLLYIGTSHLVAEANTSVNVSRSTGTAITVYSPTNASLTISLPSNSALTLETTGGDIWVGGYNMPSVTLENAGGGDARLNAYGGSVTTLASNALTVENGVTFAGNTGNMRFLTYGTSGTPTITIDGTVTSSAAGNYTYDSNNTASGTTGLIIFEVNLNSGHNGPSELGAVGYIRGVGNVLQTGTGTTLISFSGGCCDPSELHIAGSLTANAGANGRVYVEHPGYVFLPPLAVEFDDNASLNVQGQSMLVVRVPMLLMGANSAINVDRSTGTAISFTGNFVSQRAILVEDGQSATIHSGGGTIALSTCCSNSMTFGSFVDGQSIPLVHQVNYPGVNVTDYYDIAPTSSSLTTTLNLTGAPTSVNAANITVNDNMVLSANNNITLTANWNPYYGSPGTLTNNGLVTTSNASGVITVNFTGSATGPNFLYGDGSFVTTGGGTTSIVVSETSSNGNLTFGGSLTYNPGSTGTVTFGSTTSGAQTGLTFAANTIQTVIGAPLTVSAARVAFGNNAELNVQRSTGVAVTIQPGTPRPMTITAPSNGTATLRTTGGTFAFTNFSQQPVTFATSGSGGGTLSLQGGSVAISNPNITVNSGFTLASNSDIAITASYNNTCTGCTTLPNLGLVNNGLITSSKAGGIISYTLSSTTTNLGFLSGTGEFSVTGGGAARVNITNNTAAGTLNIGGSLTYDPGASGQVVFTSNATGSRIKFSDNAVQHVENGAQALINTPNLLFGANVVLNVDRAIGTAVSMSDGSGTNSMVITMTAGSNATINTWGGSINITATPSGQSVTFANSSVTGPLAVLNLNGGNVNVSTTGAGVTTINNYVCVACDRGLNVTGNFVNNSPCLEANDNITISGTNVTNNGSLSSANNLTITTSNLTNNGSLDTTFNLNVAANTGSLNITGTGDMTGMSIHLSSGPGSVTATQAEFNGTLTASAGNNLSLTTTAGDLNLDWATAGSTLSLNSSDSINVTNNLSGANVNLTANDNIMLATTYATNTLNISAGGDVLSQWGYIQSAETLVVNAGGDVGGMPNLLFTTAHNVTVNAGGNAYIEGQNSVNLGTSSAGNTFLLRTPGGTISGDLTANNIELFVTGVDNNLTLNGNVTSANAVFIEGYGCAGLLTNNGDLTAGTAVNTGTITLNFAQVDNNGTITAQGPNSEITVWCQNCDAHIANDGTIAAENITASSWDYYTVSGNGSIHAANSLNVSAGLQVTLTQSDFDGTINSSSNGTVSITSAADFTVGTVNGSSVSLTTLTGSNGSIEIEGDITAANAVSIDTDGSGAINQAAGTQITTANLHLFSDFGNVGSLSNPIYTNAAIVTANTTGAGNIYIHDTDSVTLQASSAGDSINISAEGNITIAGLLSGNQVNLTTSSGSNGNIDLGDNIAGTSSVSLVADGAGNITQTTGALVDTSILSLTSDSGSIGSASDNIHTTANSLTVNTGNSAYVTTTGSVVIDASSAGNTLHLSANGNITNSGEITANNLSLTTSANGNINIVADLNASSSVNLDADGSGSINQASGTLINTTALNLLSDTGNLGTADSNINTSADMVTGNTGLNGDFFLSDNGDVLVGNSSAGDQLQLTSTGSLTTTDSITAGTSLVLQAGTGLSVNDLSVANGSILAATNSGNLLVQSGATVTANEGNIVLINGDGESGSISLGASSEVSAASSSTNLGDVFIVVGAIPSTPAIGPTPANTTNHLLNGGDIYYGSGITANAPNNNVTADGGSVTFDTGNAGAGAISLEGNVLVSSTAAPDAIPLFLTSLDLTDPNVTAMILQMQNQALIGGTLVVDTNGVAIGGNAVITPGVLSTTISAAFIPENVTLSMDGFGSSTPLNINLSSSSTSQAVFINGTQQFVGSSPSSAVINVSSAISGASPLLVVGPTGLLTSNGDLTVNVGGNLNIGGTLYSQTATTINGTAGSNLNVVNNGTIASVGLVSINNTLDVTVTGTGRFTAASENFTSTSGSVYVCQGQIVGTVNGQAANNFFVGTLSGSVTIGSVSAQTMMFNASSTVNIGAGAYLTSPTNTLTLSQNNLSVAAGAVIEDDNVNIYTGVLTNNGTIRANNGTLTINNNGGNSNCFTCGGSIFGVNNQRDLTVNNNGSMYAFGNVSIVDNGGTLNINNTGSITATKSTNGFCCTSNGGNISLTDNGGGILNLQNSGLISATGTFTATDNGGKGSMTVNNTGTGTIKSGMLLSIVQNGGGSYLSVTNNGVIESACDSIYIRNNGGDSVYAMGGNMSAALDITYRNNGGNITMTNSGAVSGRNILFDNQSASIAVTNNGSFAATGTLTLDTTAGAISVTGSGSLSSNGVSVANSSNCASCSVTLTQGSISGKISGSTGGNFFVTTASGGMTVGDITSNKGSITLVTHSGALNVAAGSDIFTAFNLTIQNTNTSNGTISIGANSTLEAIASKAPDGNVYIIVGAMPASPVVGSKPANVTVVKEDKGGKIYYGANSISATGSNNKLTASGSKLVFSTGSRPASAITLGGNVTIVADPPMLETAPTLSLESQTMSVPTGVTPSFNYSVNAITPSIINPVDVNRHSGNVPPDLDAIENADYDHNLSSNGQEHFTPIAYTPSTAAPIPNSTIYPATIATRTTTSATIKHTQANLRINEDQSIDISQGEALINATHDSVVTAGTHQILIKSGTIALIDKQGDVLKVRNVFAAGASSVKVVIDGQSVGLSVGQELIVKANSTHRITDSIGRRNIKDLPDVGNHHLTRSEVSLLTLLVQDNVFASLRVSNDGQDKKMIEKLLKMAACLHMATQGHGAYNAK